MILRLIFISLLAVLCGCQKQDEPANGEPPKSSFRIIGNLESKKLDEASGIQAGSGGVFFIHNDEGDDLFAIDGRGRHLGRMHVKDAKNKDWEDITRVPGENGPLLVIGDIGDKHRRRKSLRLYFVPEPPPDRLEDDITPLHRVKLRLPDRPTDIEAMAWDPSSGMILFLSKPDQPPKLYGIDLEDALREDELEMKLLGDVPGFRQPTSTDIMKGLHRGMRVSQPTGMDISPDGRLAAVITYRSLYLFWREEGESWAEAFRQKPDEYPGPPGVYEEAVSFSEGGKYIYVTSERRPAPLSLLELPQ